MKRTLLLALIFLAAGAAPASATTLVFTPPVTPIVETTLQTWVDESLMPTPTGNVRVALDSPEGAWVPWADHRLIHSYPVDGYPDPVNEVLGLSEHLNFMHEVGHVFDMAVHGARRRALRDGFADLMPPRPYWMRGKRGRTAWDLDLREKFAMAYTFCAVGITAPPLEHVYWGYGYDPTPRQQRLACNMIRRAARL